jgi:transposase
VIKNLQSFFNAARINIMKKYKDMRDDLPEYYWLYKKYWRLLNKNPEKLRWKRFKVSHSGMMLNENEIVSYMLSINKDLADAYELIVEYKVFNSTATIDNAKEKLDNLMMKFHNSKLKEMRQGYRLLKNWYQEIINSYNKINGHLISNDNIERANRNTKDLIRASYGFSNFERFRNRVLYTQNDDAPIKLK